MKRGKFFEILVIFSLTIMFLLPSIYADLYGSVGANVTIKGSINCEGSGTFWSDYSDPSLGVVIIPTNDYDTCFQPGGYPTSECCPAGHACQDSSNGKICVFVNKFYCHDFDGSNESECEGASFDIANRSIDLLEGYCGEPAFDEQVIDGTTCINYYNNYSCSCNWDSDLSTCEPFQNISSFGVDCTIGDEVKSSSGNCTWDLISWDDQCNSSGYIAVSYKGIPSGENPPENCVGIVQKTIDCSSVTMMDFFEKGQFFQVILILTLIYVGYFIYTNKIKK